MSFNFETYIANLKAQKSKFPIELYEFASDIKRYELNDPQSLHDSWVTSVTIAEKRNSTRPFDASLYIVLNLLGQRHDRDIVLIYEDVKSYKFLGHENEFNYKDTFHGDVLTHQVSLADDLFRHSIELRSGSEFSVTFTGFSINEITHT